MFMSINISFKDRLDKWKALEAQSTEKNSSTHKKNVLPISQKVPHPVQKPTTLVAGKIQAKVQKEAPKKTIIPPKVLAPIVKTKAFNANMTQKLFDYFKSGVKLEPKKIENLLNQGANPNALDSDKNPPLLTAMLDSDEDNAVAIIKLLLKHGADPNALDMHKNPLLTYAISFSSEAIVKALLEDSRTNIKVLDPNGNSPLILAVTRSDWDEDNALALIKLLLKHGADPNALDIHKNPLLTYAICFSSEAIVKALLEDSRTNIKVLDSNGNSPLISALMRSDSDEDNAVALIKLLLKHGADPNALDIHKNPLLTQAIRFHREAIVKTLLEDNRTNIEILDLNGNSPLMLAMLYPDEGQAVSLVKLLLKSGANPNALNIFKNPLLTYAAFHHSEAMVKAFLEDNRTNIEVLDSNGISPLDCALMRSDEAIVELLLDKVTSEINLQKNGETEYSIALYGLDKNPLSKTLLNKLKKRDNGISEWWVNQKLIAHRFGFDLTVDILKQPQIHLEGCYYKIALHQVLESFDKWRLQHKFQPSSSIILDAKDLQSVQKILHKALRPKEIQLDNPSEISAMSTGWEGHSTGILIYDDILIKCNRGEGCQNKPGMLIYKIGNRSKLKESISLLTQPDNQTEEYFYKLIDKNLNLTLIDYIPHREQHAGNCAWASTKLLLKATIFAQILKNAKSPGKPASAQILNIHNNAKKAAEEFYRSWFEFDRESAVEEVLKSLKKIDSSPYSPKLKNQMKKIQEQALVEVLNKCITGKDTLHRQKIFERILKEQPQLAVRIAQFKNPEKINLLEQAMIKVVNGSNASAKKVKLLEQHGAKKSKNFEFAKTKILRNS
jgi:ankyrin repeat protein